MANTDKKLYKISEIAKFFNITTTTLRYYEDFGLLTPAFIDEMTKYRYYDTNNVNTVAYIISMRKSGMGMTQIKNYFNGKLSLDTFIDELKKQRFYLDELIKSNELRNSKYNKYDVDYVIIPPTPYVKKQCVAKDMDMLYSLFYEFLQDTIKNVCVNENINTFIEFDCTTPRFEDIHAIMGLGIKNSKKHLGDFQGEIKGIHTFHKGSYETIGKAYDELNKFAIRNEIQLVGNSIEQYYESFNANIAPQDFLTEIIFPIKS